jgi:hypothetical protein
MVATTSVVSKFLGPISLFVDGKLIREKVKFYSKGLEFPENESEEFEMLSEDLQKRVGKFHPKPGQDLLQLLKSFDRDDTYNIRMVKKMIITKKPFVFVYRLLNLILDEMKETALAILCEAATREGDDDDLDSD